MPIPLAAIIVGGLVSGAATMYSGYKQAKATEKAGKLQYQLAREEFEYNKGIEREDRNKAMIGTFSKTMDYMATKDANMTNFMLSLYGNNSARRMG